LTHHACFLNIWPDSAAFNAASSATKILLNHNSGLFLFSAMLWILSASSSFVHVDGTTCAGSGILFCVLHEHFLELPSLATLVRDFVLWQTNSLFRFSSALKVLGDLLRVIISRWRRCAVLRIRNITHFLILFCDQKKKSLDALKLWTFQRFVARYTSRWRCPAGLRIRNRTHFVILFCDNKKSLNALISFEGFTDLLPATLAGSDALFWTVISDRSSWNLQSSLPPATECHKLCFFCDGSL
jgi:hypothetical protein